MSDQPRREIWRLIEANTAKSGRHIYLISGGATPRFAYTIGLTETSGFELVLAGALFYSASETHRIVNGIADALLTPGVSTEMVEVDDLGTFSLRPIQRPWIDSLLLGASDFYGSTTIEGLQIVPDPTHFTLDVPDLSLPAAASQNGAWRWLSEPWPYDIPEQSVTATDLIALQGRRITEVWRWEPDYWEMFAGAGPDTKGEDVRIVPLGVLLAADETLRPVVDLPVGGGLWRDADSFEWHKCERSR